MFDIDFVNSFLKNKKATYDFLTNVQGHYLPHYESKAITEEYLIKVLQKKVYVVPRSSINSAPDLKQKVTISEILTEIQKIIQSDMGIDLFYPPDKQFLLNVLYSLNKDHPYFTIKSDVLRFALDEE